MKNMKRISNVITKPATPFDAIQMSIASATHISNLKVASTSLDTVGSNAHSLRDDALAI